MTLFYAMTINDRYNYVDLQGMFRHGIVSQLIRQTFLWLMIQEKRIKPGFQKSTEIK